MRRINYNILFVLLTTTILLSCKENKVKKLQNEIEEKIKTGLNDPDSYEFNHFYIDSIEHTSTKELITENLEKIKELQKLNDDKNSEEKIKNNIPNNSLLDDAFEMSFQLQAEYVQKQYQNWLKKNEAK